MSKTITSRIARFRIQETVLLALCASLLLSLAAAAFADEENSRLYRTRAEKREAGVRHQWTPWFSTTSFAELEWVSERYKNAMDEVKFKDTVATLQLGAKIEVFEHLVGELVIEYDTEFDKVEIDEGALEIEYDEWQLAIGKYYLPFGEYYSSFITDPVLQLGEVRAYAATLSYEIKKDTDLSLFGYRSAYDKNMEFGVSFDANLYEHAIIKLGYINEFTADEAPSADGQRTVPALTGHLLWLADNFELSLEALGAVKMVLDEESIRTRPVAWNLELTYIPHPLWDLTIRVEGSKDVNEAPKSRYGIALNARLHKNVTLGIEALHGRYANGAETDSDSFDHVNTISALLGIAF